MKVCLFFTITAPLWAAEIEATSARITHRHRLRGGTQRGVLESTLVSTSQTAGNWRIAATQSSLPSRYWDIRQLQFYSSPNCSGTPLHEKWRSTAISSGYNGDQSKVPKNVLNDNDDMWGGRADGNRLFWVGVKFFERVTVRCVMVEQFKENFATKLYVQATDGGTEDWYNVWEVEDLVSGKSQITESSSISPLSATSEKWRVTTSQSSVKSDKGRFWDIRHLRFYSSSDCSGEPLDKQYWYSATVTSSGHANNMGPANVLKDNNDMWGGRVDRETKLFWIEVNFDAPVTVQCVLLEQFDRNYAKRVFVLFWHGNNWQTIRDEQGLHSRASKIPILSGSSVPLSSDTAAMWRLATERSSILNTKRYWDVRRLRFFSSADCSAPLLNAATAISSGYNNDKDKGPENVLKNDNSIWGGRADSESGRFWIGVKFDAPVEVRCVLIDQEEKNYAEKISVETKGNNGWSKVWEAEGLRSGTNPIVLGSSVST